MRRGYHTVSMSATALLGLLLAATSTSATAAGLQRRQGSTGGQCYYPDGTPARDYPYVRCDGTYGPASAACCYPGEGDVCLEGGICDWVGRYPYRATCSDPTWSDPSCPSRVCPGSEFPFRSPLERRPASDQSPSVSVKPHTWLEMKQCTTDLFCCRTSSSDCCTDGSALFSPAALAANASAQASASASASASPTETGSSGSSSGSSSSGGLSTGAAIGIGVGGGLAVILLAGLGVFFLLRSKKKAEAHAQQPPPQAPPMEAAHMHSSLPPPDNKASMTGMLSPQPTGQQGYYAPPKPSQSPIPQPLSPAPPYSGPQVEHSMYSAPSPQQGWTLSPVSPGLPSPGQSSMQPLVAHEVSGASKQVYEMPS